MNKHCLVLCALAAGALLLPDVAEAQRGRGGGARIGGGGLGGGTGFRGGGFGSQRMYLPRGGSGFRGGAIVTRPGWGGGYGRSGWRAPYYGRVAAAYRPYYRGYYGRGGSYPYYGGAVAAGLISGLTIGALSYPYSYGYPYGYYAEGEPYGASAQWPPCMQGPPLCTAAGYPNLSLLRRAQGAPF